MLRSLVLASLITLAPPVAAQSVDLSTMPLAGRNLAKPNLIFGLDDSGSMDSEVLLATNDGALWWNTANRNFWTGSGASFAPNFNAGGGADGTWKKFVYLFPNGTGSDARTYGDSNHDHFAVPPTRAYAWLRSAAFNPVYYDPSVTYAPWPAARIDNATRSFGAAVPAAARSHPWFGAATLDLTATALAAVDAATNRTFRFYPGMVIPGGADVQGRRNGGGWQAIAADITVAAGDTWDVIVPYWPASYWFVDATCKNNDADCTSAPDGRRLRLVEIRASRTTYPSGRSYAAELQNFANWFTYYRKRKLAIAGGMGQALAPLTGLRGGVVRFNALSGNVRMFDFGASADSANVRALLGPIYTNPANGGTPMRQTLNYIGQQFMRTDADAPIQFGCQRNAAFLVTDGYANANSTVPPAYDASRWTSGAPYSTTFAGTLADIAASYYTNNPRPDLPAGLLAVDPTNRSPNNDRNTDLHMNTYAITLGALGTLYGTGAPAATNPFVNPPAWPNPTQDRHPNAVDDLWHATLNGRGQLYTAYNANDVRRSLEAAVRAMLVSAGSDAGIAVSSYNVRAGNNTAYVSSYNAQDWSGELAAYSVDLVTGNVDTTPGRERWSAREQLNARSAGSRTIATFDGAAGVPFRTGAQGLASSIVNSLALTDSPNDGAQVLAWLRGDRTGEGTIYRARTHLLGDIVSAEPVFQTHADGDVVYQAANDGMVHAFDARTGAELWAYIPGAILPVVKQLASPSYQHRFFVDGTPTLAALDSTRTILVGGLRGGGAGFYALDVTDPRPNNERALADRVLWEFPSAATPAAVRAQIGASYGKPVIVKTSTGRWVVLLTSGYNNASGQSHLHVLDAVSGALLRTITLPSGQGLAQLSAWVARAPQPAVVDYAWGGDLAGHLWRFDLRGDPSGWSAVRLASFGANQPITSAPELATVRGHRVVVIGTGRLLGDSDAPSTAVQSMYGLKDDLSGAPTIADPRDGAIVVRQSVTVGAGGVRTVSTNPVDWSTQRGWAIDLPASGERVSTDPTIAFGAVVFTTNVPSPVACQAQSFLYALKLDHGGQLDPGNFEGSPWSGRQVGYTYASRPVIVALPNGKVVSITHKSDASIASSPIPVVQNNKLKKHGWREVIK